MKRIIYSAAIAALLVTSCQKTDVLNVVEDAIEFGTEVGKLTKAETKDYSNDKYATLRTQGFRVWTVADFTSISSIETASVHDGEIYNGMDGLDVAYNNGWGFANGGKYMWPQNDQYLYFYTISSANKSWLSKITGPEYFEVDEKGSSKTEITLPVYDVAGTAHDDIMVADDIYQHKGQKDGKVVRPNFRHTMTKVEFNFVKGTPGVNGATVATSVIVKEIKTSELSNQGTLTVKYSTDNQDFNCTWEPTAKVTSTFTGTPKDVVTIVKKGGKVVRVVTAAPTDAPTAEDEVVVYTKTGEGENQTITRAEVYKAVSTTTNDNGVETPTWSWSNPEIHVFTEGAWSNGTEYETLNGFVLRTAAEIQTATNNTDAKYDNFVTWYMIPQDLESASLPQGDKTTVPTGSYVTIKYIADGKPLEQDFNLAVTKTGATADDEDWEETTCVKYNVTIAPHKILFNPDVKEWTNNDDIEMNN